MLYREALLKHHPIGDKTDCGILLFLIGVSLEKGEVETMVDEFMQMLFSWLSTLIACLELNVAVYHFSLALAVILLQ